MYFLTLCTRSPRILQDPKIKRASYYITKSNQRGAMGCWKRGAPDLTFRNDCFKVQAKKQPSRCCLGLPHLASSSFPCTPTTTSASQASFCAAVTHRHPRQTSRPAQIRTAAKLSRFQSSTKQAARELQGGTRNRYPSLHHRSNASASHVQTCMSVPECCSPPSRPRLMLSKKVTAAGQGAAWQKEIPSETCLHAKGWVKLIPQQFLPPPRTLKAEFLAFSL